MERKDTEPDRYSATQVATFRDCRRKWFLGYVVGYRGPQNAYAALGEHIHKVLEAYLDDGTLPGGDKVEITVTKPNGQEVAYTGDDLLQIILSYLADLPTPGQAATEGFFELDLGELGTMVGYIDYQVTEDVPVVGDHKTTSDLGWALTKDELREDPQATIYAVKALEESDADRVRLRWGYVRRDPKKPGKKIVEVEMSLTDTSKSWQGILEDVKAMRDLRASGCDAGQTPYNAAACDKYGGCPYRGTVCKLTPMERMKGKVTMLNLKERMKAAKAAPATAATVTTLPTTPTPAQGAGQAVNPPEGQSALARLKARQAQAPVTPAAVTTPIPTTQSAPVAATPAAQPTPSPAVAAKPVKAKKAAAPTGMTLYIGCRPSTPCQEFSAIGAIVGATIEAEKGVPYRLIEGLYGGNAALFAKTVGEYLDLNPQEALVVDLASEMARDALDALIARAAVIVRGF